MGGLEVHLGAHSVDPLAFASNRSSSGALHLASFGALYRNAPSSTGAVEASVHGALYLSQAQAVPLGAAHSVRAVLRTPDAYVDRVRVRVAFQLRDAFGHVMVDASGASVVLDRRDEAPERRRSGTPAAALQRSAMLPRGQTRVRCIALLRSAAPHRARPSAQAQPTGPPCAVRQPEAIPKAHGGRPLAGPS